MKKVQVLAAVSLAVGLLVSACSQAPVAGGLEPQFGKAGNDQATEVAVNAAHPYVFVAGTYSGEERVFIREYNKNGKLMWERLLPKFAGYSGIESADTDNAGNAYLTYSGDNSSDSSKAVRDRYLVKFDKRGKQVWRKTLSPNSVGSLAVDNKGSIWVTSNERGALLQKYAPDGRIIYESEFVPALSLGSLNVSDIDDLYAETTDFRSCNEIASCDFQRGLRKYASNGQLKFEQVVSESYKSIYGVAFSKNSVFVVYREEGSPGLPIYVKKYSTSGKLLKKGVIATGAEDYTVIRGVSADSSGNLYLAGTISSYNPKSTNPYDAFEDNYFVSKYSPSLKLGWTYNSELSGTYEIAFSVTARTTGEIYAAGYSDGRINGKNNGEYDAFLLRLNGSGQKAWIR